MSDVDLRITLESETYAGIAWMTWQAAIASMQSERDHLAAQLADVVAENAALRKYRPQPSGAEMMEALDAFYEYHEDVPEQGMMAAFEILCCKRPQTPATDSFIAEQQSIGIQKAAASGLFSNWVNQSLISFAITVRNGDDFAAQLRNEVKV